MEDFSFPAVTQDQDSQFYHLPFPHFTTSPLWFIPSVAPFENSPYHFHRKILSDSEKDSKRRKSEDRYIGDEEKMDMLWENFNEELLSGSNESSTGKMDMLEKMKKGKPLILQRRSSLIFFIEILKKLFLINKRGTNKRIMEID